MTIIPMPIPMNSGHSTPMPAGSGKVILAWMIMMFVCVGISAIIGMVKRDDVVDYTLYGLIAGLFITLALLVIGAIIAFWN